MRGVENNTVAADDDTTAIYEQKEVRSGDGHSMINEEDDIYVPSLSEQDERPPVADDNSMNTTNLIIHIGPVKTGTSIIQYNLGVNPFLKESSYEFLGKKESQCNKKNPGQTSQFRQKPFAMALNFKFNQTDKVTR